MNVRRLNDAPVLDQVAGQYEKFLVLILRKYLPEGATITANDIETMVKEERASIDPFVLFVHGHKDLLEFKAIRMSAAQRLASHEDATNRGRA